MKAVVYTGHGRPCGSQQSRVGDTLSGSLRNDNTPVCDARPVSRAWRRSIRDKLTNVRKSWAEIEWGTPRPSPHDLDHARKRIHFVPSIVDSPAALHLVDTFRSILINGGAHIAAFLVDDVDDAAHWFLSRNRFSEFGFIERLLTSDALAIVLPDVLPVDANPMEAGFVESSALLLGEQLAGALVWGGSYANFDGSREEAKRVGANVSGELLGERYGDFRIDRSFSGWSEWFQSVAWDKTWIITDKRTQQVTLLCLTDTD